eukprot:14144552-Alexandrium_andersonii.AAC.1
MSERNPRPVWEIVADDAFIDHFLNWVRTPSMEAATDFLIAEERHLAERRRLAQEEARTIMTG